MNRLLIKLEFFFYFFKSKILKKKIFTAEEINTLNFKKKISEYKFKDFWFLNNVEIINYFLPKFKDVKFDYLEIIFLKFKLFFFSILKIFFFKALDLKK